MRLAVKHIFILGICVSVLFMLGAVEQAHAYEVTLSLYNQGFDINAFYNNGDFDVAAGIVEADPSSLLVIVGDPANVEETLEIPEIPDPFELAQAGSDFHFEDFQPFRFQDRFDGLFSTTVDDPVLLVPDNGTVTAFRDDGLLADDRIDLAAYVAELPDEYYEMDWGDTLTMATDDGTNLFITQIHRNDDYTVTFDISNVPEPGTIALLGLGLVGLFGVAFKKRGKMKMKKAFSFMMIAGVILLATMLYAANSYAYEIGPEFCAYRSESICTGFQGAYHSALGRPIGPATKSSFFPLWTQKFEKGYINCVSGQCAGYSQAQDPAEVAIMLKWQDMQAAGRDIGNFTSDIVGAWGSPDGTGGHVRFFENGDIYYHGNGLRAGKAFEVHGRIQDTYNREGGTASFLGFPISDEKIYAQTGYSISYFEGGCITSENGIDYDMVVKGCKEGQPIQPPKLIDATPPACVNHEDAFDQEDFDLKWESYEPTDDVVFFDPNIAYSRFEMVSKFGTIITPINHEGFVYKEVDVVNEEIEIAFDRSAKLFGIDAEDAERISKVLNRLDRDIKKFGSLEETLKRFGGMQGKWPDCTPKGFLGFRICWEKPKFDPSVDFGAAYSLQCCPSDVKGKIKGHFGFAQDFGKLELYSPRYPVGYGFFVGAKIHIGAEIFIGGSWETTCSSSKACFDPNLQADIGGGLSGVFLDAAIARADLEVIARANAEISNLCYYFDDSDRKEQRKVRICLSPKVVGEVELFSFLKKSVEANIGGKWCPIEKTF